LGLLVLIGVVAAAVVAARARPSLILGVLLAETLLFPSVLLVPGSPSGLLTVHRVVLAAAVLGTVRAVRVRTLPSGAFMPTVLHLSLVVFSFVTLVLGVLLAGDDIRLLFSLHRWLMVVDATVFFAVVVAHLRGRPDLLRTARGPVLLVAAVLVVAVVEKATGSSYGAAIARWVGQPDRAFSLETRGGATRVRASAEFALALGWIVVLLLPLLLVVAGRTRARAWTLPVVLAAPVLAWTYSRSAYAGAAAVLLVVLLSGALEAPFIGRILVGIWVTLPVLASGEVLDLAFRSTSADGAVEARTDRLPLVFDVVSDEPFTGLGFTALQARVGLSTTDSGFLLLYAETGAIGVVALLLVLGSAAAAVASGLAARDATLRGFAWAGLAATVALAAASLAFDTFSGPQALRPFLLVMAFAVVAAERNRGGGPDPLVTAVPARRVFLFSVAFLVGMGVFLVAPRTDAREYGFTVFPTGVASPGDFGGRILINTLCAHATERAAVLELEVDCAEDRSVDSFDVGVMRLAGEHVGERSEELIEALRVVQPATEFHLTRSESGAVPAAYRTAPAWMPLLVGGSLFLFPRPRLRSEPGDRRRQGVAAA